MPERLGRDLQVLVPLHVPLLVPLNTAGTAVLISWMCESVSTVEGDKHSGRVLGVGADVHNGRHYCLPPLAQFMKVKRMRSG